MMRKLVPVIGFITLAGFLLISVLLFAAPRGPVDLIAVANPFGRFKNLSSCLWYNPGLLTRPNGVAELRQEFRIGPFVVVLRRTDATASP